MNIRNSGRELSGDRRAYGKMDVTPGIAKCERPTVESVRHNGGWANTCRTKASGLPCPVTYACFGRVALEALEANAARVAVMGTDDAREEGTA